MLEAVHEMGLSHDHLCPESLLQDEDGHIWCSRYGPQTASNLTLEGM